MESPPHDWCVDRFSDKYFSEDYGELSEYDEQRGSSGLIDECILDLMNKFDDKFGGDYEADSAGAKVLSRHNWKAYKPYICEQMLAYSKLDYEYAHVLIMGKTSSVSNPFVFDDFSKKIAEAFHQVINVKKLYRVNEAYQGPNNIESILLSFYRFFTKYIYINKKFEKGCHIDDYYLSLMYNYVLQEVDECKVNPAKFTRVDMSDDQFDAYNPPIVTLLPKSGVEY